MRTQISNTTHLNEIPPILRDKIHLDAHYDVNKEISGLPNRHEKQLYQQGSFRLRGNRESTQCYFLTRELREVGEVREVREDFEVKVDDARVKEFWTKHMGPPPGQLISTNPIDFAMIITAKSHTEARDKMNKMLEHTSYESDFLEPVLEQLRPKARGASQKGQAWKRKAMDLAGVLYYWLKVEILIKMEGTRYPEINTELKNLGLKKAEWKRHDAVKILTYELLRREFPGLSVEMSTFDRQYIHSRKLFPWEPLRILWALPGWTSLANKFLHNGKPELWWLSYESGSNTLVIKKPHANQILSRNPLECSFDVFYGGGWQSVELRWQKFDDKYYWTHME